MPQRVDAALALPRAVGRIALLFAAVGLLLAGIGVYATLSHSVVRRTREFGVRRALGANNASVLRQVMAQVMGPMLSGLLLGLPLAWLFGRQLQAVLYEVLPWDPRAWLVAILVLAVVGIAAALLPGRRALRVAPMVALRHE
jgi:ABC-type antimicrobial peptide transport system permease subunit